MQLIRRRDGGDSEEFIPPMLSRLHDDIDRMFQQAFGEPMSLTGPGRRRDGWFPALDISETDNEITIRTEVAGMKPGDLNITVVGNTLTITGEKKSEEETKGENYYHCERRFGSFRRAVTLPDGADPEQISADYANGVATIHVAKKPTVKPRQVEIKEK